MAENQSNISPADFGRSSRQDVVVVFSGQVLTLVEELLGEEEVYDERDGYGPYGAAYAVRHEERKELGAGGKA